MDALALCISPASSCPTLRPGAGAAQRLLSMSAPCVLIKFCFPSAGLTLDSLFTLSHTALPLAPACPSSPASGRTSQQAAHGLGQLYTFRITYRNLLARTDPALMPAKELSEHFLKESIPPLFFEQHGREQRCVGGAGGQGRRAGSGRGWYHRGNGEVPRFVGIPKFCRSPFLTPPAETSSSCYVLFSLFFFPKGSWLSTGSRKAPTRSPGKPLSVPGSFRTISPFTVTSYLGYPLVFPLLSPLSAGRGQQPISNAAAGSAAPGPGPPRPCAGSPTGAELPRGETVGPCDTGLASPKKRVLKVNPRGKVDT